MRAYTSRPAEVPATGGGASANAFAYAQGRVDLYSDASAPAATPALTCAAAAAAASPLPLATASASAGVSPALRRTPAIFAPPDLYSPPEWPSTSSRGDGRPRRVLINEVASPMEASERPSLYSRDAGLSTRAPPVQVLAPTPRSPSRAGARLKDGSAQPSTPTPTSTHTPTRTQGTATAAGSPMSSAASPNAGTGRARAASVAPATAAPSVGSPPVVDLFSTDGEAQARVSTDAPAQGLASVSNAAYVAQSAYTQRNPFRVQTFADFAAHPNYDPPESFLKYPEAVTACVALGLPADGGRAMLGEFIVNRLADAAQPVSEGERADMIELLSNTLEILQEGDWFFKWSRTNTVHRRLIWLNMQRGTLAWSPSPKRSLVWNSELKLTDVTSVKPDSIRDGTTGRIYYRMLITTASRCLCLATEMREKFDCWFKALQQLTLPNLSNGIPTLWGRPTYVVNNGRRGAVGRWASRYSPLQAIADGVAGSRGPVEVRPTGRVLSSD